MGMQINTNMAANNAYRSLSNTQTDLSKSLEKLSSGLRINRAGDDAAGLALSEGLKSQIGGLSVAARNAQDGIGAVQTAEGGLNQAHSILQRLRDLGVQAANDTNSTDSRKAIKTEADSLVKELDRIAGSTNFNGAQLLDGSKPTMTLQVGANSDLNSRIDVDLSKADVSKVVDGLGFGATSVKAVSISSALDLTAKTQFTQGGTVVTVDALGVAADTSTKQAKALNGDAGFNQNFTASVDIDGALVVTSKSLSSDDVTIAQNTSATPAVFDAAVTSADASTLLGFDSASAAQASITAIDTQIKNVSTARAELGATQNRLESAVQTINVAKENLTASNSRIRDTDMAEEMVKFTRNNILSQAGTAMLAQANQSNQGVLQLLR